MFAHSQLLLAAMQVEKAMRHAEISAAASKVR